MTLKTHYARRLFDRSTRALIVSALVICAGPLAGPLSGQSWQLGCGTGSPTNICALPTATAKIGLGTATPSSMLSLFQGNLTIIGGVTQVQTGGPVSPSYNFFGNSNSGMFSPSGQHLGFSVGGVERLRITATDGNVGIGVDTPDYKLSVNGTVQAKEVRVDTIVADYVFQPDYRLTPLSEVAAFIQEHRHLPDIPSEREIKAKGVGVGEMQAKLLAKIEELTLHMIQADERNNRLEQQNRELQERIARLERGALRERAQADHEEGEREE